MERFKLLVKGIVRYQDTYLVVERWYDDRIFDPYQWEFLDGVLEFGETPEAALVREIREELSAEIRVDTFLHTVDYDYPQFHLTMHCYMCSLIGEALHLNEHEAARWLTAETLRSVQWLPADEELLPLIEAGFAELAQ